MFLSIINNQNVNINTNINNYYIDDIDYKEELTNSLRNRSTVKKNKEKHIICIKDNNHLA